MATSYDDDRLAEFVQQLSARTPAPGGGAATAVTVSLAAGLVAMAARFSSGRRGVSEGAAGQAEVLRDQALELAGADADAYAAVLAALRLPRDGDERAEQVRQTLTTASEVQLKVAEVAVALATMAAELSAAGKADVGGDARTGLLLAEAGVRSAAQLVSANVSLGRCDAELVERSTSFCDTARAAVQEAMHDSGW